MRPVTVEEQSALPTMMAVTYPPNPRYYRYYRDHHGSDLARRLHPEVGAMGAIREQAGRVLPA